MSINEQQIQMILDDYLKIEHLDITLKDILNNILCIQRQYTDSNLIAKILTRQLEKEIQAKEYQGVLTVIKAWLSVVNKKKRNTIDIQFDKVIQLVEECSTQEIYAYMKQQLFVAKETIPDNYQKLKNYYKASPLWGEISVEEDKYELLELRSKTLKDHLGDFVVLYESLEDYRSKYCLLSTLLNWLDFNFNYLFLVKERIFDWYFDLDLLQFDSSDVILDLGAYRADTLESFIRTYGGEYKRYYCYEIDKENINFIQDYIKKNQLSNVIIREVAAGKEKGELYYNHCPWPDSYRLNEAGDVKVDVVSMDEDVAEPVTFIKMDIEGAEYDALLGCKKHILNDHPKMAISVYHNNDDIWKIPKMIRNMDHTYKFYLRYYGGNLLPVETTFFAI